MNDFSKVTFNAFIMSLATQALIQLGESKAPAGVDVKEDINEKNKAAQRIKYPHIEDYSLNTKKLFERKN